MPKGTEKDADVPAPSAYALKPEPASVVTTPDADKRRTRIFSESATAIVVLSWRTMTPDGNLKAAEAAVPSL